MSWVLVNESGVGTALKLCDALIYFIQHKVSNFHQVKAQIAWKLLFELVMENLSDKLINLGTYRMFYINNRFYIDGSDIFLI